MHVRSGPHATLVELCEQSLHAFVTFGSAASTPPAFKVGTRPGPGPGLRLQGPVCISGLPACLANCWAFICPPLLLPPQASCNDMDSEWELDSAYWLEKLAGLYSVRWRCGGRSCPAALGASYGTGMRVHGCN